MLSFTFSYFAIYHKCDMSNQYQEKVFLHKR